MALHRSTAVKVGVFVITPAQVHFFRPLIALLRERGHDPILVARYHPETRRLLEETGEPHVVFAVPSASKWGKLLQLPRDVASARRIVSEHKIDVTVGFGPYHILSASSLGLPSILFTDTEARYHGAGLKVQYATFARFATTVVTPAWLNEDLGSRQVRIRAFKEVAYLHPDRFQPSQATAGLHGVDLGEPFAFVRLSAHGALHDAGHAGLNGPALDDLLGRLGKRMRVWASFEGGAPAGYQAFACPADKSRIHDLLYHAAVVIGDSGSIPAEAALLGAPSLRFTTRPPEMDMEGFRVLEREGLMETFRDPAALTARAEAFPLPSQVRQDRRAKAERFLRSLDDPLAALADCLEAAVRDRAAATRKPSS